MKVRSCSRRTLQRSCPGPSFGSGQAAASDAIRLQSGQFRDGPDHWDFDLGGTLGGLLAGHAFGKRDFIGAIPEM